jgi:hypothetical protein
MVMTSYRIGRLIQSFAWTSEDQKEHITFDVTAMLDAIRDKTLSVEAVTTALDANFAETWVTKRDLNNYYCRNMSLRQMKSPVLGVWMLDGSVLLIDGSHRYMARYYAGYTEIDYLLVAYGDWQGFAQITEGNPQ